MGRVAALLRASELSASELSASELSVADLEEPPAHLCRDDTISSSSTCLVQMHKMSSWLAWQYSTVGDGESGAGHASSVAWAWMSLECGGWEERSGARSCKMDTEECCHALELTHQQAVMMASQR